MLANAVLAKFPDTYPGASVSPALLPDGLYTPGRYTVNGWQEIIQNVRASGTNGTTLAGTWSGTGPYTSSTAGNSIIAQFIGSECLLRLDCGAGTGVVSITIDAVPAFTNIDLSTYPTGQRYLPLTGLHPGVHNVVVTLVSGTITFRGLDVLRAPVTWCPISSPRVTLNGTGWTSGTSVNYYGLDYRLNSATSGISIAFDFIGTALGAQLLRATATHELDVTIDGVAYNNIPISTGGTVNANGGVVLVSGLSYGRHSAVISPSSTIAMQISGLFWWDESQFLRPTIQRGMAVVGEAVTYPTPYGGVPVVQATPLMGVGDAYPTSVTASGLTMSGTTNERGLWTADGSRIVY